MTSRDRFRYSDRLQHEQPGPEVAAGRAARRARPSKTRPTACSSSPRRTPLLARVVGSSAAGQTETRYSAAGSRPRSRSRAGPGARAVERPGRSRRSPAAGRPRRTSMPSRCRRPRTGSAAGGTGRTGAARGGRGRTRPGRGSLSAPRRTGLSCRARSRTTPKNATAARVASGVIRPTWWFGTAETWAPIELTAGRPARCPTGSPAARPRRCRRSSSACGAKASSPGVEPPAAAGARLEQDVGEPLASAGRTGRRRPRMKRWKNSPWRSGGQRRGPRLGDAAVHVPLHVGDRRRCRGRRDRTLDQVVDDLRAATGRGRAAGGSPSAAGPGCRPPSRDGRANRLASSLTISGSIHSPNLMPELLDPPGEAVDAVRQLPPVDDPVAERRSCRRRACPNQPSSRTNSSIPRSRGDRGDRRRAGPRRSRSTCPPSC